MIMYGESFFCDQKISGLHLIELAVKMGYKSEEFYILCNGKKVANDTLIQNSTVQIVPRLPGGKGGFGSMLRAIGAQIEKTTNREACRDLSGRRLRDINEEKRLKNWINQQAEREKEAKQRKQKKLERLCEKPKHEFKDEEYDKERSALPEKVENAVLQGLEASCSTKRKCDDMKEVIKKKKPKLWDDELDEEISSSEDVSDDDDKPSTSKVSEKQKEIEQESIPDKTAADPLAENKILKSEEKSSITLETNLEK